MKIPWQKIYPVVIIIISFALAFILYSRLPAFIASHWGPSGQADGYMPKNQGLFFMPVLSIVLYLIFLFLPQTDPYRHNFRQFENYFNNFIVVIFSFLFYLYCLTLVWNLGTEFNMVQLISPAFSLLFYYAGILISHARRNWFVGIRTPWTMSSDLVWDKTHHLGGKLFRLVAIINLFGILVPDLVVYFMLFPVILVTIFIFIYSYVTYRQQSHG